MEDVFTFVRSLNGLLVFVLGRNEFCMNITHVSAVIKPEEMNKYYKMFLPKIPLTNKKNETFPLVNTEKCFGCKVGDTTSNTRVILINCSNAVLGMYVDKVKEFISLSRKENENNLSFSISSMNPCICGQVQYEGQKWMLPDIDRICSEMFPE